MRISELEIPCKKIYFFPHTSKNSYLFVMSLSNYQLVVTVVMKNCEPLVSLPAFAIDRSPSEKIVYTCQQNR